MMREKFLMFYKKYINLLTDYKVTLITTFLITMIKAVFFMLEYEFDMEIVWDVENISRLFYYFGFGAFFIETLFIGDKVETLKKKRLIGKIAACLIAGFIAVSITYLSDMGYHTQFLGKTGKFWNEIAGRFTSGYLLLLVVGGVYLINRKKRVHMAEYRFETYILHVFSNLCKTFLVYLTLTIGAAMVGLVIDILFLDNEANLCGVFCIFVIGFYLVPGSLYSLLDVQKESGAFLKMMVRYVFAGLTLSALAIVYLYVLKIVILWEMPSNEIFSIISALFCLGMPVWIMAEHYRDETKYSVVLSVLPYVFAPLMLLQAYSIGVRIYHNGLTQNRYIAVMLIVFEIAILIIWHWWKNRRENILLLLFILVAVSVFVPGVNMYSLSNRWQFSFLQKYYQMVEDGVVLSELEFERLEGAYGYLREQVEMDTAIAKYAINADEFMKLLEEQNAEKNDYTNLDTYRIYCTHLIGELDTTGYNKLNIVNSSRKYNADADANLEVDFSDFVFIYKNNEQEIRLDISTFADKCITMDKEISELSEDELEAAMIPYYKIAVDENAVLYINNFEVKYKEGIKDGKPYFEWEYIDVDGILLEK